jgi:hypothetical protein
MKRSARAVALVLALLAIAPGLAAAGFGDHQTLTGEIRLWGPNRFGQQLAVVEDDRGETWIVRFAPGTLPPGAAIGTQVTMLGREVGTRELDAIATNLHGDVSALPAGAASGWAVVPGLVHDATGTLAVLRAHGGMTVTVDVSELDAGARTWLAPGRGVTVVGVYRPDGVLAARGVATTTP